MEILRFLFFLILFFLSFYSPRHAYAGSDSLFDFIHFSFYLLKYVRHIIYVYKIRYLITMKKGVQLYYSVH
jgi:hypothetical protein